MADRGGGVLFVMSPIDCTSTAEVSGRVSALLGEEGIPVKGLVIGGRMDAEGLQDVLEAANKRFPHAVVSERAAVAFVGRSGTPVVMAIGANRDVRVLERFGLVTLADVPDLTKRLVRGVGGTA